MSKWIVRKPPAYLEKDEVWAIINTSALTSKHTERDKLLLWTMWETGGRVTEVTCLTAEQIDQRDKTITLVNLKQRKKGPIIPERMSPAELMLLPHKTTSVSRELADALTEFCQKREIKGDMWVFFGNRGRGHINRNYAWHLITKASREARVSKRHTEAGAKHPAWPHLFRHACAMYILDQTGKTELAQWQLGHSSIITTQAYALLKEERAKKQLSDLNWGPEGG